MSELGVACRRLSAIEFSSSLTLYSPLTHLSPSNRRVDTYSFGVVISEVYSRKPPFSDVPRNQKTGFNNPLIKAIKAGRKRVRNDASWGAEISDLVDRCTWFKPDERPAFGEVAGILKSLLGREAGGAGAEGPLAGGKAALGRPQLSS